MFDAEQRDDVIGRALRDLDPRASLDDLSAERLARRIADAARHSSVARPARERGVGRLARVLAVVSVAASIAIVAAIEVTGRGADATVAASSPLLGVHVPEPANLLAAAIGAESETDFLERVTGTVDDESMLAASVRQ